MSTLDRGTKVEFKEDEKEDDGLWFGTSPHRLAEWSGRLLHSEKEELRGFSDWARKERGKIWD